MSVTSVSLFSPPTPLSPYAKTDSEITSIFRQALNNELSNVERLNRLTPLLRAAEPFSLNSLAKAVLALDPKDKISEKLAAFFEAWSCQFALYVHTHFAQKSFPLNEEDVNACMCIWMRMATIPSPIDRSLSKPLNRAFEFLLEQTNFFGPGELLRPFQLYDILQAIYFGPIEASEVLLKELNNALEMYLLDPMVGDCAFSLEELSCILYMLGTKKFKITPSLFHRLCKKIFPLLKNFPLVSAETTSGADLENAIRLLTAFSRFSVKEDDVLSASCFKEIYRIIEQYIKTTLATKKSWIDRIGFKTILIAIANCSIKPSKDFTNSFEKLFCQLIELPVRGTEPSELFSPNDLCFAFIYFVKWTKDFPVEIYTSWVKAFSPYLGKAEIEKAYLIKIMSLMCAVKKIPSKRFATCMIDTLKSLGPTSTLTKEALAIYENFVLNAALLPNDDIEAAGVGLIATPSTAAKKSLKEDLITQYNLFKKSAKYDACIVLRTFIYYLQTSETIDLPLVMKVFHDTSTYFATVLEKDLERFQTSLSTIKELLGELEKVLIPNMSSLSIDDLAQSIVNFSLLRFAPSSTFLTYFNQSFNEKLKAASSKSSPCNLKLSTLCQVIGAILTLKNISQYSHCERISTSYLEAWCEYLIPLIEKLEKDRKASAVIDEMAIVLIKFCELGIAIPEKLLVKLYVVATTPSKKDPVPENIFTEALCLANIKDVKSLQEKWPFFCIAFMKTMRPEAKSSSMIEPKSITEYRKLAMLAASLKSLNLAPGSHSTIAISKGPTKSTRKPTKTSMDEEFLNFDEMVAKFKALEPEIAKHLICFDLKELADLYNFIQKIFGIAPSSSFQNAWLEAIERYLEETIFNGKKSFTIFEISVFTQSLVVYRIPLNESVLLKLQHAAHMALAKNLASPRIEFIDASINIYYAVAQVTKKVIPEMTPVWTATIEAYLKENMTESFQGLNVNHLYIIAKTLFTYKLKLSDESKWFFEIAMHKAYAKRSMKPYFEGFKASSIVGLIGLLQIAGLGVSSDTLKIYESAFIELYKKYKSGEQTSFSVGFIEVMADALKANGYRETDFSADFKEMLKAESIVLKVEEAT